MRSGPCVVAVDQGTTSTRCAVVDRTGRFLATSAAPHTQHTPRPGWLEHDPVEIWRATRTVIAEAIRRAGVQTSDVVACGVTTQRETAVVWERDTGRPIHRAVVWQDTRTADMCRSLAADGGVDRFRTRTGLPISHYFTGPKISWVLDSVPGARRRAEEGELLAGTMDSWLMWNLTGGVDGGTHVTDVTNASRTMLMDLDTLEWDPVLAEVVGVPEAMLPGIRPSIGALGRGGRGGPLAGIPIGALIGDQQAGMFGQACFSPGDAKATFGTGMFLIVNTGTVPTRSKHGLLTTVAYQAQGEPAVYAMEGAVSVAGSMFAWLRNNLGLISDLSQVESLARSVENTGGVSFVPAFAGLLAPRWAPGARGTLIGLTRYTSRAHVIRAALEASGYQTREVLQALQADLGLVVRDLRVDGGMSSNDLLLELLADILNIPVRRPDDVETTVRGAALAAGLSVGLWKNLEEIQRLAGGSREWRPTPDSELRTGGWEAWNEAVARSLDWDNSALLAGGTL